MFEASGRTVTFLKRISMGPIELDSNIAPGDFRELNDRDGTTGKLPLVLFASLVT